MRASRRFRPSSIEAGLLEDRVVLNSGGLQGTPLILRGAQHPGVRPRASAASLVDQAFQSFRQEYGTQRAVYLAAVAAGQAKADDRTAFAAYTNQRVNLLSQQVVNSLLVFTESTTRGTRSRDSLPVIQAKLINANDPKAVPRGNGTGTLAANLVAAIPAVDASPTTVSFAVLTQDNAIEAARVSVQNGVTIIRNGNYGTNGHASRRH